MIYFCCNEHRRDAVKAHDSLNGIDFLEVDPDQLHLSVYFLKPLASDALTEKNVQIEGGDRIRNVAVVSTVIGTEAQSNVLTVTVDKPGDFTNYTLRLVPDATHPLNNFDPLLKTVNFSFKVNCPSDFDCQTKQDCPPEPQPQPDINYLAKDYASFRQLMLDRMAVLMPQWKERNLADMGIALVELLAYVGDHLSYQQDAIATEAYLGTARRRISVRRHARLVDYFMHDGCNARVWVQVQVNASPNITVLLKKDREIKDKRYRTQFLTKCTDTAVVNDSKFKEVLALHQPEVFEPLDDTTLYTAHNEISFYTWGDKECCLPKGATQAFLRDDEQNRLRLRSGDVLIFEERLGPKTGLPADANPTHRHAVRLIRVYPEAKLSEKGTGGRTPDDLVKDPLFNQAYVEIEWHTEDALPFPLCLSAKIDENEQGQQDYLEKVSVALGNIVLADHGCTIEQELGNVPPLNPKLVRVPASRSDRCNQEETEKELERLQIFPRFRPRLKEKSLTQTATVSKIETVNGRKQLRIKPFDPEASASAAFQWKMEDVLPAITLNTLNNETWHPRPDLLKSNGDATNFVVEIETDGTAYLRFGDDRTGERPKSGTTFDATYRVGNGVRGNVGAEAIAHIVSNDPTVTSAILKVRNPLSAKGGVEPESIEDVRQRAPSAFRTQQRAVTPEDYAEVAERHPQVQKAAATFRWTGSWRTVFVTVDRLGGLPVDDTFEEDMRRHLEKFRMAGHDLEVEGPRFVSLEIEMMVCVKRDYFRSDVKAALLEVFSNRILPDGRRGAFHPDNFTFGQPVYLSRLYAAAQAVAGVASVQVTTFQRQGTPSVEALDKGKLELGRLEIARLDNDPNFPENGILRLYLEGGK